MSSQDQKFAI